MSEGLKLIRKNDKGELVSGDFTKYTPPLEVKQSDFRKKDPLAMNRKRTAIKKMKKTISHLNTSAKIEVNSFDLDHNASGRGDRFDYG